MDLLKIGQKLNLYFIKDSNIVEICCKIADVFEDRLVIDLPQYFMRYIEYLEVGCPLTIKVFSKLGTVDFNTVVISSPLEDEFSVELDYNAMKLTPSEEIPFINAILPLYMKQGDNELQVKTFEVSTEYVKFYSNNSIAINENFECELVLPKDYGKIKFRATIIEIDPVYDNEIKANYSNMSEVDRQNLLYYMYLYSNDVN